MRPARFLTTALLLLAGASTLGAQDVEMLGRRYGNEPPPVYYDELARNPDAFSFRRGRAARSGDGGPALLLFDGPGPARVLGPRDAPVTGLFRIPVLLGQFSDSPAAPPFSSGQILSAYFGAGATTVSAYYDEVSGGRVTLEGDVLEWARAPLSQSEVTQGQSALSSAPLGGGSIGNFIWQLLLLHPSVDWGLYDNDGPDGLPNSGDDDGYVDVLALLHPTRGAECSGSQQNDRIWSHKWSLGEALRGTVFETSTPAAGGGFIRIDDYFVVGTVSCVTTGLNEIGVFTHETGHAFGLPDLYDTDPGDGSHAGVGSWDLMASGAWGCDDRTEEAPCHMGAWSKAMLGWVDVTTVPSGAALDVTLPPVETSGSVLRVDAQDGSGEYYLIENRQRIGFDGSLLAEGLLIWQVDPDWVATRWADNVVNAGRHLGVRLRQADGRDDLETRSSPRGDAGDAFPGSTQKRVFHAGSVPAAVSWDGQPTGLTLTGITAVGDDMGMSLLTRTSRVTLDAQGAGSGGGLFTLDGTPLPGVPAAYEAFPFVTRAVVAAAGDLIAPGIRTGFERWSDAPTAARARSFVTPLTDTALTAEYAGREVQLGIALTGGVGSILPGALLTTPPSTDLWFPEGTRVTVEAAARSGFGFLGWTGSLSGFPNPATVDLDAPLFAGADFELLYRVSSTALSAPAAAVTSLPLEVVHGVAPISWSLVDGALPQGLRLDPAGRIVGSAEEQGLFSLRLRARDVTGLAAEGDVSLDVVPPAIPLERAASFFTLSGPTLTPAEMMFLDRAGNGDGAYDLGDFRAWVLGAGGGG